MREKDGGTRSAVRGKRDGTDEEKPAGRPSPVMIITAAVVVLILLIGVVIIILSSGSGVESLAVGNFDRGDESISFDVMATPGGFGEYDGDVDIVVEFLGRDTPVYEGKIHISSGLGNEEIRYDDFVWGNGEYTISAKADGKVGSNSLTINNVVTSLYVEWQGVNSDPDRLSPEYQVEVNVTYFFGNITRPISQHPRGYEFSGFITRPGGDRVAFSSNEVSTNLFKLQKRVNHDTVGTYRLAGALTNTFCRSDSPFRVVHIERNDTFHFDAYPFAVAGDDIETELVGGEAVVELDGSGSWDDGQIVSYSWDFGDGATERSSRPTIQHTYTETGTFYVTLVVTDNAGQSSTKQSAIVSTLAVTVS